MNTLGSYNCVKVGCDSGYVATELGCKGVYIFSISETVLVTSVYIQTLMNVQESMGVLMSVSTQWEVMNVPADLDIGLVVMAKDVEVSIMLL